MSKVKEIWRFMNEEYDSLTESEFEELKRKEKITFREVREWASNIEQLKISGSLKSQGWTQHDIDFWFDLPSNMPWNCPCKDLLKKLSEPKFGLLVNGWCGGCGAGITWNDKDKRWEWYWDYTKYKFARGKSDEGITQNNIEGIKKRLDKLEGR